MPIVTNHSTSRILINIKPGNGFTDEAWTAATKSVKICDVKTSATIDLSTGVSTAIGNNEEITPLAMPNSGTTLSYKAMIVPQVVADNSKLIVVTIDGVEYVYRKGYTFSPNTQHTFTVTVSKNGSNVNVTIGEWEIDDTINEGEAKDESEIESTIPNNQIWYTAASKVVPYKTNDFGATIQSNEWDENTGKGIITFNGDITNVGEEAFMNKSIQSITLPNSINKIQDYAFQDCTALVSITLPNSITSLPLCAFEGCINLRNITIPNSVTKIYESAFEGCRNLTNIILPDDLTFIGMSAFNGCSSITSITIPDNVIKISMYAFYICI